MPCPYRDLEKKTTTKEKTMKMTALKIAKAKHTRFGRAMCRLFGDERGAVLMEYVLLAVLIAAAVVAIIAVFGDAIRGQFAVMIHALTHKQADTTAQVDQNSSDADAGLNDAQDYFEHVQNQQ